MKIVTLKTICASLTAAFALSLTLPAHADVTLEDANRFVKMCDTNKDGMVSKAEMMAHMKKTLASMPADKDGMVDEMKTMALLLQLQLGDGNPQPKMISKAMLMKKVEAVFTRMDSEKKSMLDAKRTMELLAELMRSGG